MANKINSTITTTTATTKDWRPHDKQLDFMSALKVLGTATFREARKYVKDTKDITITTGAVNVLISKLYVTTEKREFEISTTTVYNYPNGAIEETKTSTKEETVYSLTEKGLKFLEE